MKKYLFIIISLLIVMLSKDIYAQDLPSFPIDANTNYVVYENSASGEIELSAIYSNTNNYSLVYESDIVLNGSKNHSTVSESGNESYINHFQTKRLYFSTENFQEDIDSGFASEKRNCEYYISTWVLNDAGHWEHLRDSVSNTICENTEKIIMTNKPLIEKFRKSSRDYFERKFNGNNYYVCYLDKVGDYYYESIDFSDDGVNFEKKIVLPENVSRIDNIVYGNGLYVMISSPVSTFHLPEGKRPKGFTNDTIAVYNESFELVDVIEIDTLRDCIGFYNGYFYFYDKNYYENYKYMQKFYKSANGTDYIEITEDEYKSANNSIQNNNIQTLYQSYIPKTVMDTQNPGKYNYILLNRDVADECLDIAYENNDCGFWTDFNGVKQNRSKKWVSFMNFKLEENGIDEICLTIDGVYGVHVPYYEYRSVAAWASDQYIYFNCNDKEYSRIAISDMIGNTYVRLNDKILGFSQPPVTESDLTLVPMRFLFEQMGAEVTWDDAAQTAMATVPVTTEEEIQTFGLAQEKSVTFSVDNTTATVNGSMATMDVPARLINDQTMVPLRFLSENLGFDVSWDEASRTAIVTTE